MTKLSETILPSFYGELIPNLANITSADVYDSSAVNNSSSYSVSAAEGSTDLSVTMVANTTTPTVGDTILPALS